jgi:hypothetical protein
VNTREELDVTEEERNISEQRAADEEEIRRVERETLERQREATEEEIQRIERETKDS